MIDKRSFYFIRHAQSEGIAHGYHQGHADFTLTEFGVKQTNKLAKRLTDDGIKPGLLLSSTLTRASQTVKFHLTTP